MKVIDHQTTGKQKFIIGKGRKKDTTLSVFEDEKTNHYDKNVNNTYLKNNVDIKVKPKNKSVSQPKSVKKVNKHLVSIKQIVLRNRNNGCLDKKDIIGKLDEIKKICMN